MPVLTALLLAQAAPMAMPAEKPEPVCIRAGDLPPAFAGWNAAPSARLQVGVPFVAIGVDPMKMAWATGGPSARAGKSAIATFRIARAGVYRVGLSTGAWIDVVAGRRPVPSIAHEHGPICTGLRKIVDFRLAAGTYALQLAGMPAPSTKVMIVRR